MRKKLPEVEREKLCRLAQKQLWSTGGENALEYLTNKRKFDDNTIKKFKIGYVPHWIKSPSGGPHEFSDKIIYPIYNQYEDIVSITSRSINPIVKNKFFHESYDKQFYIYGLNLAKEYIKKYDKCIVTEGQHDVMTAHKFGFQFTVGILGSAFHVHQLSILMRYCKNIYMCFDSDSSGRKNANRMLEFYKKSKLYLYECNIFDVELPTPEELGVDEKKIDVDYILNYKGKNFFLEALKSSKSKELI